MTQSNTSGVSSTKMLEKLAALQRAAAKATQYHGNELAEAILHHCAIKVASSTAPTVSLVGKHVTAEIQAKHRLLRMAVPDLEGIAVRGRYLQALSRIEDWELDEGTVEAMVAGMVGAAVP